MLANMTMALIALGSNLGKRQTALRAAIERLRQLPDTRVLRVATFRETEPVDAPAGSPSFINSAVALETGLSAEELLAELLRIERDLGRDRKAAGHIQNGPRVIDLDLVLFGDETKQTAALILPHPRMHQRRFVLEPLAEIAPGAYHPTSGRTVRELLLALDSLDKFKW
jgi:3-oxoacyl-[acyl-carrier protein] reductase